METPTSEAWSAELARVADARGKPGAEYNGAGRYGVGEALPGFGGGGGGGGSLGSGPLDAAMGLAKLGDPRSLMALLFQKGKMQSQGYNGLGSVVGPSISTSMQHAGIGTNFNLRGGLEGQNKARQSVQSMQRPGGGMMGPAPAKAGPRTQGQQDYDAERERRRRMADMDAEMAQKVKWMNAMGLGGPAGQVSETEVTGQLYNNAGAHKVMPITTKRTRDITPQERAQFYQMIMGGK